MINEAAINAVKQGREYVCQKDLFEAVEQVLVISEFVPGPKIERREQGGQAK